MNIPVTIRVITVLAAVLLPAGYAPSAAELLAPTRTLEKASIPEGKLMVFSEPPGLPVTLDGQSLGKTPAHLDAVTAGTHSLRVESRTTEISIAPGKTLGISLFKGDFVRLPEVEEPPAQPPTPTVAVTPSAKPTPPPARSGVSWPDWMTPNVHRALFGYE